MRLEGTGESYAYTIDYKRLMLEALDQLNKDLYRNKISYKRGLALLYRIIASLVTMLITKP